MKRTCQKGFSLIELMVVVAIISILVAIAMPRYANYVKQVNATSCLSNRRNIEMDEMAKLAHTGKQIENHPAISRQDIPLDVVIHNFVNELMVGARNAVIGTAYATSALDSVPSLDASYTCPSDGVYIWLVSDATSPEFPKVGCSSHYGSVVIEEEPSPTFEVDTGVNLAGNGDFEILGRTPKKRGWTMVNSKQVDDWDSSNGKVEVWADGMLGVDAPSGDYFIELDTDPNRKTPDILTKSVETEPGRVYLVQMNARARVKNTSDFTVSWGEEIVSEISPTHGQWSEYSVKVVGNGEPINLALAEIPGQNNGLGALIDSIEVITTDEVR